MKQIYFNNCLTSKPAPEVVETMIPYLKEKFYFPENFISDGSKIAAELEEFKKIIADSLGAKPSEIHFTSGGTSAGVGDLLHQIINDLGEPGIIVHGVSVKPGKPIIIAVLNGKPMFGNAGFGLTVGTAVSPSMKAQRRNGPPKKL